MSGASGLSEATRGHPQVGIEGACYNSIMRARLATLWNALMSSYWFVPALMVTGSILLALVSIWADYTFPMGQVPLIGRFGDSRPGAAGVRDLLNAVAGGMITIAGVTFSITIVALSLASQQFGPRLLYNFMRDRGNQLTLGTFIATFTYAVILLRITDDQGFVPSLSVTLAIAMMLAAVAVLIYFFHHVSASIQADKVISSVVGDLNDTIDRVCGASDRHCAGIRCATAVQDNQGSFALV